MAQPSYAPAYVPVSVIGSQYMAPHRLNVIVFTNSTGDHLITDAYHNTVMFKVKPCHTICHNQLALLDRNDTVIVMLREKMHPMQLENERFYKDKFMVTIYPDVDGAFVISLIAIIEAMKSSHKDDHHACQVNDDVGPMVQVVAAAAQVVTSIVTVAQTVITNLS